MRFLMIGAVALATLVGCAKHDDAADSTHAAMSPTDSAAAAAKMANAIEKNPTAGDSILADAGYTPDSYKAFMYRVAGDSAMSAAYASAKAK